jgi:hypothetical protein
LPPIAFIVGVVGLSRGHERKIAIASMVISGLCMLLVFGVPILDALCR